MIVRKDVWGLSPKRKKKLLAVTYILTLDSHTSKHHVVSHIYSLHMLSKIFFKERKFEVQFPFGP